jgi:hypothetical protein
MTGLVTVAGGARITADHLLDDAATRQWAAGRGR